MKIAVQIYGHARSFEQTSANLHQFLIQPYDADIYMHMWNTTGFKFLDGGIVGDGHSGVEDGTIISEEQYRAVYNPTNIVVEEYTDEKRTTFIDKSQFLHNLKAQLQHELPWHASLHRPTANFSQWYKWYSVNELRKQSGITYDFVFMVRTDVMLGTLVEITTDMVDSDHLYMGEPWKSILGASDIFVAGSPKTIDVWCNLYNEPALTGDGWRPSNAIEAHTLMSPHHLYEWYCNKNNIQFFSININGSLIKK